MRCSEKNDSPQSAKPSLKERVKAFGRIYFSKNAERTLFFFLTAAMLLMGLLVKMELL
jgi:hypothetical protein